MEGKTGKAVASQQTVSIFPIPLLDNTPCYRVFFMFKCPECSRRVFKIRCFFDKYYIL